MKFDEAFYIQPDLRNVVHNNQANAELDVVKLSKAVQESSELKTALKQLLEE